MMTLHELTTAARARLAHHWELNGQAANPTATIRRIVNDSAPTRRDVRRLLEEELLDQWAQLCAEEGGNDDHLV